MYSGDVMDTWIVVGLVLLVLIPIGRLIAFAFEFYDSFIRKGPSGR